ncbi:MAG: gluconate 2-dehydrogenase subunit 3 family protein [Kangiellaceae bacterium]|nr:gluconate 2-dehydrogenase subunit 3 family protein [Kangiellaceae bacterium]
MHHEYEFQQQLEQEKSSTYQSQLTRRESLRWLGLLSASIVASNVAALGSEAKQGQLSNGEHWPKLDIKPLSSSGYGKDPKLIVPPNSPWPRSLTTPQLVLVAVLSDILVPREGNTPSATEVKVPEVIDEWVSAPYPRQQRDRVDFLHALAWIDDESKIRFGKKFVELSSSQQIQIMDDIAYNSEKTPQKFLRIVPVFSRFRRLVLAAFFCSPEGIKDIGYIGNVAIAGDYPGPSKEAMEHLNGVLKKLNLEGSQ